MRSVQTLIDEAVNFCQGQAELARRVGMTRQDIQHMQAGKRTVTPETVALICDVLELSGEEARRLAAEAIVANPKNADRREVLRRAFFVGLATGAALICGYLATERPGFDLAGLLLIDAQFIHRALSLALVLALAGVLGRAAGRLRLLGTAG